MTNPDELQDSGDGEGLVHPLMPEPERPHNDDADDPLDDIEDGEDDGDTDLDDTEDDNA